MTAITDTLRAVCDMAGQVPDISVLSSEAFGENARICILSRGDKAISALQRIALSANASIEPWIREPMENTETEQIVEAGTRARDGMEHGELQILGIHLIWHLHKLGLLSSHDANSLLHKWGAVSVGA